MRKRKRKKKSFSSRNFDPKKKEDQSTSTSDREEKGKKTGKKKKKKTTVPNFPMVAHTRICLDLEEDEAVLVDAEEALRGTPEDPSPTIILEGVKGTLKPERDVAESTPGEDGHGSSTAKGRDQEETLEEYFEG